MSRVTVTGATSLVGHFLIPTLEALGAEVRAVSRVPPVDPLLSPVGTAIHWTAADICEQSLDFQDGEVLIHLAPIWTLPAMLTLAKHKPYRIIAFSSTSRFSKIDSDDDEERSLAQRLIKGEEQLVQLGEEHQISWTLFRPTLIYGAGLDENVGSIAQFIERFGFFPVLGKADGMRMPVHASDIASACIAALKHPATSKQAYNLTGDESLSYREMVHRVFTGLERRPRIISIPESLFKVAIKFARKIPGYQHLNPAMATRMNEDLTFDSTKARLEFGYQARPFKPTIEDLLPL